MRYLRQKLPRKNLPWIAGAMLMVLAGCAGKPPEEALRLEPVSFAALAGWARDDHGAALGAFRRSCAKLTPQPESRPLRGAVRGRMGAWRPVCAAAGRVSPGGERVFFESWFRPHRASGAGTAEGLFTGYYEAGLRGSRVPGGPYRIPLYRQPGHYVTVDLGRFKPEWKGESVVGRVADGRVVPADSRAEIDQGALAGRNLELLWVDDAVDAFFLHIQGSGRVTMDDGGVVRVGYAGRNGHAYVAIGRELIAEGAIRREDMSMQAIRAWLAANPHRAAELMARNPSYVFFRELEGEGPIGAQGAPLTPGRSLAVDRRFVPLGVPIWLETRDPVAGRPLHRLLVAQDTGGAIKGAVRGDVFWGHGPQAAGKAGVMKEAGRYFLLLPKGVVP